MHKSKLTFLLKSLLTKELRNLKDFIESPYHNKNQDLVQLYGYLYNKAPHFKAEFIDRHQVFKIVYGSRKFDQKQFYHLESRLLKLVEKFLQFESFKQDEFMPDYYLLKSVLDRSLPKNYNKNIRQIKDKITHQKTGDISFYKKKYLIYDLENQKFMASNVRKVDSALEKAASNFDLFYLCQKLKYTVEILSRNKIQQTDFKITLLDEIKKHLEQTDYTSIPEIYAYKLVLFILIEKDDEKYYSILKDLVKQQPEIFHRETLQNSIGYMFNYCVEQMRKGNVEYNAEALDLYILGFDYRVLLTEGYLSPWNFKNVVQLGVNLKRYDWTENFIYDYIDKLHPKFKDNALNYNLAELFYAKNEWDKVIEHLSLVKLTDVSYSLGTKLLLCKVYFQTNETEALYSLIISFKIYLKRQKSIQEDVRAAYLNFLYFLSQLMKDDVNISKLKEEISNTPVLVLRNWLSSVILEKE